MNSRKHVVVIYGGPSHEHDISVASGKMVIKYLDKKRYKVYSCKISRNGKWSFNGGKNLVLSKALTYMQKAKFDVAFLALHGPFGEDGTIQALLTSIDIRFTGSGAASSALAMDKNLTNSITHSHGILIPKYIVVKSFIPKTWKIFPVVVKPVRQGSSYGTSIIKKTSALRSGIQKALRFDREAMLQEWIVGQEISCGVIEDSKGKLIALPPTLIIPIKSKFFDLKSKYSVGGSNEITPAPISPQLLRVVKRYSLLAHGLLGCSGISRSDFILRGKTFYYLETNTIPGFTETSLLPQQAKAAGISFPHLLDLIVASAMKK